MHKRLLLLLLLLSTACYSVANPPFEPGKTAAPHTAYTCTASIDDAGPCIADFRTGAGSDCVYTCADGTCDLIRVAEGGYEAVATCVAPE